jgi:hypothetical protein
VSAVLEAAMVMGWFVALVLGEKLVSQATTARRTAEDSARSSASTSAGGYCAPARIGRATVTPSIDAKPKLDAQAAIGAIAGLGLGAQRTFPYYVLPLLGIDIGAEMKAVDRRFAAVRRLGCLERPLDTAAGSLPLYRHAMWLTTLKGY